MATSSEGIAKDIPEMVALLSDINDKLSDANKRVLSLTEKVDSNTISAEKGVSFLEMKFHLLLSYLINLVHYMLLKTEGKPIENSPTIDRLVEIRTVMEKIRPIDQKLKYQVDKLIKIATTGGVTGQENDPLRFKPRPDDLISKLEPNTEKGVDDEDSRQGIYVPPKVAAVHFDDKVSKRRKSEETARKKALSSSLLKELRDEYSEAPNELKEGELFDSRKEKEKDDDKHQQRYEEDNMVRLMTKKRGKPTNRQSLDDLTKFTDLTILTKNTVSTDESEDNQDGSKNASFSRKKRKSRSSGKSSSGKKQKRSFRKR